nr:mitogen activated protein kinase kinase kinase [Hymenolepis microstoma]
MSAHCLISEQKLDYIREVVNHRDPKEDYKLIRSIGVGTYGEVYKALRLNTKDYAAVKIIKVDAKDDIKAVLQEIQTLRDCRHRNIVQFFDSYFRMAPEVVAVERKGGYDEKCDIWAVGITAIEYAELQPPMFDLNPLKSNKFHGFLKYALTKNEKKRPTAELMLGHEFVTQPTLSQNLTLQLLQQNRNPEPFTFGQPRPSGDSAVSAVAAHDAGCPPPANQVQTPVPGSKRPAPANAHATNGSAAKGLATPKASHQYQVNIKTPVNRFPFSSAGLEAASKYVATHQEEMGMVSSKPSKAVSHQPSSSSQSNGVYAAAAPERILPTPAAPSGSVYPRFPVRGNRLEDVRIMDELATPLPAYAANAPTASPAPKPPPSESPITRSGSPVPSAASFSSASTSPCSTISSSSSGTRASSSSSQSSSVSSSAEEDGDDDQVEESEGEDEEEISSEGEAEKPRPSSVLINPRMVPLKPSAVANDPEATPQPVRSVISLARTEVVAPAISCNGSTKSVVAVEKALSKRKEDSSSVEETNDEQSRTLTTSEFATADLDLDVADEQLLAADGVLTLGKRSSNRTDSVGGGDRISEFGFRMHGNPSEEEDDDDEDEEPDFENIDPEAGFISHPGAQPSVNQGGQQRESRVLGENGVSQRRRPKRGKSDPKMSQRVAFPQRQASESIENPVFPASGNIQSTQSQQAPTPKNDFFPEKTGAELADILRQIKFAQKFAWLAGEPSAAPLGLSSFNPGSVPTLHHATSSPDAITRIHHVPNGCSDGGSSNILVPLVTPNTEVTSKEADQIGALHHPSPQPTVVQPVPRPKTSVPSIPSSLLGRPTISLTTSTSYLPFILSSGVQSVTNLATEEAPTPTADESTATSSVNNFNSSHPEDANGKNYVVQKSVSKSTENSESSSFSSSSERSTTSKSQQQQQPQSHLSVCRSTEIVSSCSVSSSCPSLIDLTKCTPPQRWFLPRKTASAPSITEEDLGEEKIHVNGESSVKATVEPVMEKSTPNTATAVNVSTKSALQRRVLTPAYLSPQPSRLLRRLRQSPNRGANKVRPTSVSVTSIDHDFQKLSRLVGAPPWARQSTTDLPPTPQVHMGACFTLVFEGCPLTINSTASWINPANNAQILLFGSTEGVYFLSLKDLADRSLELLASRYCHWLAVVQNTMVSVSGNPPHLYTHNLTTLMKMKASGHSMNAKLKGISNLFPKRFSPSNKVSKTKGCLRASLVRSPFTGARYLCAAFPHEILVMEWVNTLSTFIETKRVPVLNMPTSLTTFDLLVQQDLRFPLACLGVYRHHSRRGLAGERYRLHLVDLNSPSATTESSGAAAVVHHSSAGLSSSSPPQATSSPISLPSVNTPAPGERKQLAKAKSEDVVEPTACRTSNAAATALDSNSLFLDSDRLPVVSVIQLLKNTVLVCFPDCAKLVGFSGRLRKKLRQPNTISFDGLNIQSVVGLRDSLLVFHPHGFLGKSFAGELTQEINDDKHIYRVLGHDRNIVVESRPVGGPSNNSNIYLLAGHTDNSS